MKFLNIKPGVMRI